MGVVRNGEFALAVSTPITAVETFDDAAPDLYRTAYRVAFKILGERTESEDIAQETLARACVHWNRINDYAGPWTVRVAGNLAVDHVRRRRFHSDHEPEPVSTHDPDAGLRLDLQRALVGLSDRERQVITLRYLGDLPYADVAAAMGCGVGTAKRYASRALAKLRSIVGDVMDES